MSRWELHVDGTALTLLGLDQGTHFLAQCIWHETYLVKAGQYEAVYGNMPAHGLGKAGRLVPVSEASSGRGRLHGASE
jgi:hypothetical protein